MQRFYSNGKLLLSGEYLILDGAQGLALPTILGQEMTVDSSLSKNELHWESLDKNGNSWFSCTFSLPSLEVICFEGEKTVATTLKVILLKAKEKNPSFLNQSGGVEVSTKLQFDREWGLGSSSTLINNIAQWSENDPFELLFDSFGGSGYDIACARTNHAILYELNKGLPKFKKVDFDPSFKNEIYFVHLNKKQNSRDSIKAYKKNEIKLEDINHVSKISNQLLVSDTIEEFEHLLNKHESIISKIVGSQTVQQKLFPDFGGQVKSLGAWGGDFVLATGDESTKSYFINRGFETIIPFTSMIQNS